MFKIINDDEQKIVDFFNLQRRVYTIRVRVDHMNRWDDEDFRIRFRISKDVVRQVLGFMTDQISSQSDKSIKILLIINLLPTCFLSTLTKA